MKKIFLAIILILISTNSFAKEITILHFNDLHGRFDSNEKYKPCGGAARLATAIRNEMAKSKNPILLFGGDAFTGSIMSDEYKGEIEIKFLNAIKTDVAVIGNHEFDFGPKIIRKRMKQSNFPWLGGNIFYKKSNKPFAPFMSSLNIDGTKICVIGLTTPTTPRSTLPKNTKNILFKNPISILEKHIEELSNKCDSIIALTHLGVRSDIKLAKRFKNIDAVIGGHDHVRKNRYCKKIKGTPVCQTPAYGSYLGKLTLDVSANKTKFIKSELLPINCKIQPDAQIEAMLKPYSTKIDKKYGKHLCQLDQNLYRTDKSDSPLGNTISDILRKGTKTDFAFINSGALRANLHKGKITASDLITSFPFNNYAVILKIPGSELIKTFQFAFKKRGAGGLQISGGKIIECNGKFKSLKIDGKKVENNVYYTVATVDYLAKGGSGYSMLTPYIKKNTGKLLRDLIIKEFSSSKECPTPTGNRIINVCE